MKVFRNIALLFLLVACGPSDQSSPGISGTFYNADRVVIELTWFMEYFNNNRVVVAIETDEQGSFSLPLDFDEATVVGLRFGRTEMPLFVEPGDAIMVEADAQNPLATITFSGDGAANNNFLVAFHREIELVAGDRFLAVEAGRRDAWGFVALLDSVMEVKNAFLENWQTQSDLSNTFVGFLQSRIIYDRYTKLLDYPVMYQRATQSTSYVVLPEGYFHFLEEDGLFDDGQLEDLSYVSFLMSYLNHFLREKATDPSHGEQSLNRRLYDMASEVLTGRSRDYMQAMMAGRELSYGAMEEALSVYDDFQGGPAHQDYKQRMNIIYGTMQQLSAGNPAPDFTMTDMEGSEVSLSAFFGKVVVIDFWASWCGPCMREMPHVKALKEAYADEEDLVFVYVSIDTDVDAWMGAVERLDLEGVHFNTPGRERGVPALYNVKWIPTFYIIGRDGNIFDNRPPLPSQGGFDEVVAQALAVR